MKVLLTSFGIGTGYAESVPADSIFSRMPPVSMREHTRLFVPDYSALLLCDNLILDEETFDRLLSKPPDRYSLVSDTIRTLHSEGFVSVADYQRILDVNRTLLDKMVSHDLKILDTWVDPLKESLAIWSDFWERTMELVHQEAASKENTFCSTFRGFANNDVRVGVCILDETLRNMYMHSTHYAAWHDISPGHYRDVSAAANEDLPTLQEVLNSARNRRKKKHRQVLRSVLSAYLKYVNANIVISNELGVGFHDWLDFLPFYQAKFLAVGRSGPPGQEEGSQARKLFDISFPELALKSSKALLEALTDKRIQSLRHLVDKAVKGKVNFDAEFASRTLREVIGEQKGIRRWRRIISYGTMPLGFIPWIGTPLQSLLSESLASSIEEKLSREHRWYYLLSDVKGRESKGEQRNGAKAEDHADQS